MSHIRTFVELEQEAFKLYDGLKDKGNNLKTKERMAIPQMDMPAQDPPYLEGKTRKRLP